MQQSLEMETNTSLLDNKSGNDLINKLKASKSTITDLNARTGWRFYPSCRTTHASSSSNWQPSSDWKSNWSRDSWQTSSWTEQYFFFFNCSEMSFRLPEIESPGNRRVCRQHTHRAPHLLMHSCCTDLFFLVVRVCSHTLTPCTCMAQVTKHIVCVSPKNIPNPSSSRTVVHLAEPDTTHGHSFLTFS